MKRTNGALGLIAAATVVAGAVGVVTHSPTARPLSPVASGPVLTAAYTRTVATGSSSLSLDIETAVGDQHLSLRGKGAFAYRIGGQITFTAEVGGQSFSFDEVATPSALYLKLPPQLTQSAGARPWIEVSADLAGPAGVQPTQGLDLLLSQASNVRRTGTATVDGVTVTNYAADLDPTRVVARLPASLAPLGQRAAQALASAGVTSIPATVSIDRAGRVRRLTERFTIHAPSAPQTAAVVTTRIDIGNFGAPVHVQIPPADEVSSGGSIGSLLAGLGG